MDYISYIVNHAGTRREQERGHPLFRHQRPGPNLAILARRISLLFAYVLTLRQDFL